MSLTLDEISDMALHPQERAYSWYGCMLAGEAGEAANILKKMESYPGDNEKRVLDLAEELADVLAGVVITAKRAGIDNLDEVIIAKCAKFKAKMLAMGDQNIY